MSSLLLRFPQDGAWDPDKNTKKDLVWSFTNSQNKPAGLDYKRVVSRVFSLKKQPAFSLGSMAVLVGRANKGSETARFFIFLAFSPLVRAPNKTAMLRRLPTFRDVTDGFPAAQVTDHKCKLEWRSPCYGK